MNSRTAVAVVVALLLSACASSSIQKVPMPDTTKALSHPELCRIYLFRKAQPFGKTYPLHVQDGDRHVGTALRGSYLCWERLAGPVPMRLTLEREGMHDLQGIETQQVEAGRTYYWMVETSEVNRRPRINSIPEQIADEFLAHLAPAEVG